MIDGVDQRLAFAGSISGYKDFIPVFACEKFNPDKWVALFKNAGARNILPMAGHHDGFALCTRALTMWLKL